MKTKYILKTQDDRVIAIFNDLADAEEMYLAFLEEAGYEHCCRCINRDGFRKNLEDYYSPFYHDKDVWKTSEGVYLYVISGGCFPIYLIEEVPYFED